MVLVGAMVVAGIETVWSGRVTPPRRRRTVFTDHTPIPDVVDLARGEEMGRFLLGSTVILLFPAGVMRWRESLAAGSSTRLGEELGTLVS